MRGAWASSERSLSILIFKSLKSLIALFRSGEHLVRIQNPLRVEALLHQPHHSHRLRALRVAQVLRLRPSNAMLGTHRPRAISHEIKYKRLDDAPHLLDHRFVIIAWNYNIDVQVPIPHVAVAHHFCLSLAPLSHSFY